ncbi:MAG TPA: D-alanyl-D-alanine carboxypeptidase/D-alanyl-D-alanine-endopeptidase [Solirubrobacteraceae bacterium]|nr:D-alanyl-D-alanine carboxypeptidase/D-alanyl-D-alanine-endopeptidase [Solirubrobacteraceae bacterium]
MPRYRFSPLAALLCAALICAPPAAAGASTSPAALRAQLLRTMRIAGPSSYAYVYDISAKRSLYSRNPDRTAPPASVEKLYTSTAALMRLGPNAHLGTVVLGDGSLDSDGVWHGDIYLRGGGDPTFGSQAFIRANYGTGATVTGLAQQLQARGIVRVHGQIVGDESFLDSLRGGPRTGFALDSDMEGTLSALAFNRGETGAAGGLHAPAAYAALQLLHALRARHIPVSNGVATGAAPAGAQQLAQAQSPTISTLLGLMDRPSDNFFAELLVKDIGAVAGGSGTTTAGAAVVRQTLAHFGIHPNVVDGSGLSRGDRTSPRAVVTLLSALTGTTLGDTLRGALPVAGRTGTLAFRMRHTTATGRCQAKTGTLNGVSNLAGWCQATGGHTIAFCFLLNGISESTAHLLQDNMAITISGYDDGTPAPVPGITPPSPTG